MGFQFNVNKEKNTVVCLLQNEHGTFRGIAKKDSVDQWNEDFGKELAKKRAVIAYKQFRKNLINENIDFVQAYVNKLQRQIKMLNDKYDKISTQIINRKAEVYDLIESLNKENYAAQQ